MLPQGRDYGSRILRFVPVWIRSDSESGSRLPARFGFDDDELAHHSRVLVGEDVQKWTTPSWPDMSSAKEECEGDS